MILFVVSFTIFTKRGSPFAIVSRTTRCLLFHSLWDFSTFYLFLGDKQRLTSPAHLAVSRGSISVGAATPLFFGVSIFYSGIATPPPISVATFSYFTTTSRTFISVFLGSTSPLSTGVSTVFLPTVFSTVSSISVGSQPIDFRVSFPVLILPTPVGPRGAVFVYFSAHSQLFLGPFRCLHLWVWRRSGFPTPPRPTARTLGTHFHVLYPLHTRVWTTTFQPNYGWRHGQLLHFRPFLCRTHEHLYTTTFPRGYHLLLGPDLFRTLGVHGHGQVFLLFL